MRNSIVDIFLTVAIGVWLIDLGVEGSLTPERVAVALFGLVIAMAVGRIIGSGLVRLLFDIGVPLAILATFVIVRGGGDIQAVYALMGSMLPLFIALFGIYFIVRGVGKK